MPFFHLSTGLRGCYMPDNSSVIRVKTRKALRDAIRDEAEHHKGGETTSYVGLSDKAQAAFVREAWARRNDPRWTMDLALPYGERSNPGAFGIFLSRATLKDYNAFCREHD